MPPQLTYICVLSVNLDVEGETVPAVFVRM